MHLCATLSLLLALLLLIGPAVQLVWLLVSHQLALESAFMLMYGTLAVLSASLLLLVRSFSLRTLGWPAVARFFVVGSVQVLVACLAAFGLSRMVNVVDSSHGGSLVVLVAGATGALFLATSWLLRAAWLSAGAGVSRPKHGAA
jgi:hypothetical protein